MSEAAIESFSEMFEQSLANQRIRPGMILTGLVIDVGPDVVIINVGLKSEAVIPLEQFKNERGEVEVITRDLPQPSPLESFPDASRADLPSRSIMYARSCPVRWWMCARCATPAIWKASRSNSR